MLGLDDCELAYYERHPELKGRGQSKPIDHRRVMGEDHAALVQALDPTQIVGRPLDGGPRHDRCRGRV